MKKSIFLGMLCFLAFHSLAIKSIAQQPTRQTLEAKKKQVSSLQVSLAENKKKVTELELQLQSLTKEIEGQEKAVNQLQDEVTNDEDTVAFLESPPRTIVDVTGASTFLIDFNGARRHVSLHGLSVDQSKEEDITRAFRKRLLKKLSMFAVLMWLAVRYTSMVIRVAQA